MSRHLLAEVEDVCAPVVIYCAGKIHAAGALNELLPTESIVTITDSWKCSWQRAEACEWMRPCLMG